MHILIMTKLLMRTSKRIDSQVNKHREEQIKGKIDDKAGNLINIWINNGWMNV